MRPYQVRIWVLPLTTAQWRRVMQQLASQALFRAKPLPGQMPHEIEEVFGECGTPLFPRSAAGPGHALQLPGLENAGKHLAAVCWYVLAEEFDRDPFADARPGAARAGTFAHRAAPDSGAQRNPAPRPGPRGPLWTCRPLRWPSAWTGSGSPGLSPARLRRGFGARRRRARLAAAHVPSAAGAGQGQGFSQTRRRPRTSSRPRTTRCQGSRVKTGPSRTRVPRIQRWFVYHVLMCVERSSAPEAGGGPNEGFR